MAKFKRYDSYKKSGVEWLGEIPSHWEILCGFRVFNENKRKNIGMLDNRVLSLSYGQIVRKSEEKLVGLVPESFETYQIVKVGDIIVRCTDLQNDKVSLRIGLSKYDGIITSAYLNLNIINSNPKYLYYFLYTFDVTKAIYQLGSGLRQSLSYKDFKKLNVLLPPKDEQEKIASYLDEKIAKIDIAISGKEKFIELLKEQKQIIINDAVTKGLNKNAKFKSSGIEWLGQIPSHWKFEKSKWLFKQIKRPVRQTDEIVTCFRDGQVTLRANRRIDGFTNALKEYGYQGIRKGDLVIHNMDAFAGAIGISDSDGKATPVYSVCIPYNENIVFSGYYAKYLRNLAMKDFLLSLAKGIRERSTDFRFKDFGELEFPLPPKDEQEKIVEYIENKISKIDKLLNLEQECIKSLKEYKASLIDSVVTGKVKV